VKIQFLFLITCFTTVKTFAQSNSIADSSLPIKSFIDITEQLKVYPNPGSNWVFISHPSVNNKGVQLLITDINGKPVLKTEVKAQTVQSILNISQLQPGMYFVIWSNGTEKGTVRLRKN